MMPDVGAPLDPLMTTAEVAAFLRLAPNSVTTLAQRREIPGFQLGGGGVWRFRRRDVERFVDERIASKIVMATVESVTVNEASCVSDESGARPDANGGRDAEPKREMVIDGRRTPLDDLLARHAARRTARRTERRNRAH